VRHLFEGWESAMKKSSGLCFVACVFAATTAVGQNAPAPSASAGAPAQASTPAGSVGLFVYPKNNQEATQQNKDETECYQTAKTQSGVDPKAPPSAAPQAQQAKGGAVKGAAGGAAGGAAVGAIAGDAGQGAAIGSTVGAVHGRRQQKKANKQAQQQATAAASNQQATALDGFKRSMSACLDARGYSVK
jgi:Glycine-zipper domain